MFGHWRREDKDGGRRKSRPGMWIYKAGALYSTTLKAPVTAANRQTALLLDTVDVIEECYCRASITLVIIIHLLLRRALSCVPLPAPQLWP